MVNYTRAFSLGDVASYPLVRWHFSVSDFWVVPEVKFSLDNFHGYVKKPRGVTHDSSRGKNLA